MKLFIKNIFPVFLGCLISMPIAMANDLLKEITANRLKVPKTGIIRPMNDGSAYATVSADKKSIIIVEFAKGTTRDTLFSVEKIENCPLKTIEGFEMNETETRLLLHSDIKKIYRRSFTTTYYLYHIARKTFEPLSEYGDQQQMASLSPNGRMVAFARDNNLYLKKLDYDTESAITTDGEFGKIINGTPDWVYEEEFCNIRLFEWNKSSELLAFLRFEETAVKNFTFQWFTNDYPTLKSYKYPRSGGDNSHISLMVYDVGNRTTKQMDVAPKNEDFYIPVFYWTNTDDNLAVVRLNRSQNHLNLLSVNGRSGVSKLIISEKSNTYIDYKNYTKLHFNTDNSFVCLQEKDGYRHLYLYNANGTLLQQLTSGEWDVTDFYGYDETTKTVYYQSAASSPLCRQIEKCDTKGKRTVLSGTEGFNKAVFSSDFNYYIETFSNTTTPDRVSVKTETGKLCRTITTNSDLATKYAQLQVPQKEFFQFTTSEGITLNGWVVKPANFDASRRYPLLLMQYSGPSSQEVLDKWHVGWESYLAQNGIVVGCVDGRGTDARGTLFRTATYGNLGELEAKDQTEAARYFAKQDYIDSSRIGIWGWSYGGFTTLYAMTNKSGMFKVGIAVAPVTDWMLYNTAYTERFMNRPQENDKGYTQSNLLDKAKDLQGHLLIIQGTADDNVHMQNTLLFTDKLTEAGIQFEMQLYTNKNHSILGDKTRLHLYTRMSEFLFKNL
ncbi:MAG TPA: DPP IV N-terminal domain-containing protein [Paludibacteraceae bacterium]|nr:DPP IV N-terminal domain-containing protein [Paludibacteraceae bacterium]